MHCIYSHREASVKKAVVATKAGSKS